MRFWGRRPQQKEATKVITPILEVISSNISQSNFPKKSQSPNNQPVYRTVLFIKKLLSDRLRPSRVPRWPKSLVFPALNGSTEVATTVLRPWSPEFNGTGGRNNFCTLKFLILKGSDKRNDQLVLLSSFKKN